MIKLGLLGYPLGHSFSKAYYLNKFEKENIQDVDYDLYAIENIKDFELLYTNDVNYKGFNITIPHKVAVLPYINELSDEAKNIGAVNCITIKRENGQHILTGFNTDAYGFEMSIKPLIKPHHNKALVLGNGGAAKAVLYVLEKLSIPYLIVSRSLQNGDITYEELNEDIIKEHTIIINCSPLGTFPNIQDCPNIPYQAISDEHLLYDLIYNPEETEFLRRGKEKGADTKNGYEMLVLQAEKNWEIWSENF